MRVFTTIQASLIYDNDIMHCRTVLCCACAHRAGGACLYFALYSVCTLLYTVVNIVKCTLEKCRLW